MDQKELSSERFYLIVAQRAGTARAARVGPRRSIGGYATVGMGRAGSLACSGRRAPEAPPASL